MLFNVCQPLVQRCDGNNTSFRLSTRTVHMIQFCYIHYCCCYQNSYIFCISNIISLSLFQLYWFSQPPISNVLLYFLFFTFFIKFYSSIEIDCCIFFLSEILVKNVLQSFLWIQDFIILGTQDPGILRS